MGYNFRNDIICWQMSKSIQVVLFALALTVFEILTFKIFALQKVGQGQGLQFLQYCISVANIKFYKRISMHICAISNRYRYINMSNCSPSKSRSIFVKTPFGGKYNKNYKSRATHFARAFTISEININVLNSLPLKSRSGSWSTIFAINVVLQWQIPKSTKVIQSIFLR